MRPDALSANDPARDLSRITGEFRDPALEAALRRDQYPETLKQSRFVLAMGMLVSFVLAGVNVLLSDQQLVPLALAARSVAFVASLAGLMLVGLVSRSLVEPLLIVWQLVITLVAATLMFVQQNVIIVVVLMLPAVFFLAVPTRFRLAVITNSLVSLIMMGSYVAYTGVTETALRTGVALVVLNGLLAALRSRNGRDLRIAWATARSRAAALGELAQSRMLTERVFEAVPIPLVVLSAVSGKIGRANKAAGQFLRGPAAELVGSRAVDLYENPGEAAALLDAIAREGVVHDFPARIHAADGGLRSVLVSAKVVDKNAADIQIVSSIFDISERLLQEEKLSKAEAEYRALFENAVVGVYRTTPDGKMLRANPALVRLNGYSREEELVASVNDIASEWYVEPGRRAEWARLMCRTGRVVDFVSEVYRHKTRERIWISENGWTVFDEDGQPAYFEGTLIDITERMRSEKQNAYYASHDPLTDLPNRRCFMECLGGMLAGRARKGGWLAVMYLDLDRFKPVNDTFGHAAGDLLLTDVARRLRSVCRAEDVVARIGGDEFAVLTAGPGEPDGSLLLADRILAAFAEPFSLDGPRALVGVSIGIAFAPHDGDTADDLLRKADQALYAAKSAGRNRVRTFNPDLGRHAGESSADRAAG
ncbi:MAG: sensor domain-containing diguanylate cyclase [Nitratireductor sp.]